MFDELIVGLQDVRHRFLLACQGDILGVEGARSYASNFVSVLQSHFQALGLKPSNWFLAAVGGLGRGEMSFVSDVDLLFVYSRRLPGPVREAIQSLVQAMWDGGFELGHMVSSQSGLNALMKEDFSVWTTCMQTKFIDGDRQLYGQWRQKLVQSRNQRQCKQFLQTLWQARQKRRAHYAESNYLLEPNIKEGLGGLRDLHSLRWCGLVFQGDADVQTMQEVGWLDDMEAHWLQHAEDFLWRVRLQLHLIAPRRTDQLLMQDQHELATRLGFEDNQEGGRAVEGFMRHYYRQTSRVRRVTDFLFERLELDLLPVRMRRRKQKVLPGPFVLDGEHIRFHDPELVRSNPGLLMQLFAQAAKYKAHFHHETGQIVRSNLNQFTDAWRQDPAVVSAFFDILLCPDMAHPVLKVMLETGFLQTFIPEFDPLRYRVQHDAYHMYTVDEHLLRTVYELHAIVAGQDPDALPSEFDADWLHQVLPEKKVLFLAALIHDVGKGQGHGHAQRGARMAVDIGSRLGLSEADLFFLVFLVDQHLLLAETALKRDLAEERPVEECALNIGSLQRLAALYLLTVADSKATGPQVYTTWRRALIIELGLKVKHLLQQEDWQSHNVSDQIQAMTQQVLSLVTSDPVQTQVANWLEKLSLRYLLTQSPEAVLGHFFLEQDLADAPLVCRQKALSSSMWELTLVTKDHPRLFDFITGVLWANGVNIVSADIYTRSYGVAVDIMIVDQVPDPLHPEEVWQRVEKDLAMVIGGSLELEAYMADKTARRAFGQHPIRMQGQDKVVINEQASDFYTVIEVYTWERAGVLHTISKALHEFELSIQVAKISTPGAQVVDVFYVTGDHGGKILNPDHHARIKDGILAALTAC